MIREWHPRRIFEIAHFFPARMSDWISFETITSIIHSPCPFDVVGDARIADQKISKGAGHILAKPPCRYTCVFHPVLTDDPG